MKVECRKNDCQRQFEITLVFRPPAKGRGRAPDTIMELAPMPLALMGLRRFNARTTAHEYKDVDLPVNQVVNSDTDVLPSP